MVILVWGTVAHFAYGWSGGNPVVGVLAPVNESVWEHLKLVLVPALAVGAGEAAWAREVRRVVWVAKLVEIAAAGGFIVAFFYSYTGALGIASSLPVDIASFFAAVVGGQWTSYRVMVSPRAARVAPAGALALLGATVVLFAVCTYAPPHLPLFRDASTGTYGPA